MKEVDDFMINWLDLTPGPDNSLPKINHEACKIFFAQEFELSFSLFSGISNVFTAFLATNS